MTTRKCVTQQRGNKSGGPTSNPNGKQDASQTQDDQGRDDGQASNDILITDAVGEVTAINSAVDGHDHAVKPAAVSGAEGRPRPSLKKETAEDSRLRDPAPLNDGDSRVGKHALAQEGQVTREGALLESQFRTHGRSNCSSSAQMFVHHDNRKLEGRRPGRRTLQSSRAIDVDLPLRLDGAGAAPLKENSGLSGTRAQRETKAEKHICSARGGPNRSLNKPVGARDNWNSAGINTI